MNYVLRTHILKLDCELKHKYILTVLISFFREQKISSRFITTEIFNNLFTYLGYKSPYQKKTLQKLKDDFCKSAFVKYHDKVGIKLVESKLYNDFDKNNKVCYFDIPGEFTLLDFKKLATEVVYADPQAITKNDRQFKGDNRHISFTTQQKVADTLKISTSDVSRYTKHLTKYYQNELVLNTDSLDSAIKTASYHQSRCKIIEQTNSKTKEKQYLVYKNVGSKLSNSHIDWFKYTNRCQKKITNRFYQILDSEIKAPTFKKAKFQKGQNVKTAKGKYDSKDFFCVTDIKVKTIEFKVPRINCQNNQMILNGFLKDLTFKNEIDILSSFFDS